MKNSYILLLIILLFKCTIVFSQIEIDTYNIGLGYGLTSFSGLENTNTINLKLQGDVSPKGAFVIRLNYNLPYTFKSEGELYAINQNTIPKYITVKSEMEIAQYNAQVSYLFSLKNKLEDNFYFYGTVGLGISYAGATIHVDDYDKGLYKSNGGYYQYHSASFGPGLNLGFGANQKFGIINLFSEANFVIQNNLTEMDGFKHVNSNNSSLIFGVSCDIDNQ